MHSTELRGRRRNGYKQPSGCLRSFRLFSYRTTLPPRTSSVVDPISPKVWLDLCTPVLSKLDRWGWTKKGNTWILPPQNTVPRLHWKNYLLITCLQQHNKTQQKSKSIKKKNLHYSNCRHLIGKIIRITQLRARNSSYSLVWWLNHIKTTSVAQDSVSLQHAEPLDFYSRLSASTAPSPMRFTPSFTHSTTSRTNGAPQTEGSLEEGCFEY